MALRIGFDYDEPVFPWYQYAHEACVAAGLASPTDPPPTSWAPHEHYQVPIKRWIEVLDREVAKGVDGLYGRPVNSDAVAAIRRLVDMGHEVHIVTARGQLGKMGPTIKALTRSQLFREGIPHHGLHFAPDKGPIADYLRLDYFLDDRPKHVEEVAAMGIRTYLLDASWNRDVDTPLRVASATEYADRLLEHAEGVLP